MEMADSIIITKADGDNISKAKTAKAEYSNAIHLFPPSESGWIPKVEICSSLNNTGIKEIYELIGAYRNFSNTKGYFSKKRKDQLIEILKDTLNEGLVKQFYSSHQIDKKLEDLAKKELINPYQEAYKLQKNKA